MATTHVTIHMAASLEGFIARKDGRVDWLETSDEFVGADTMDPGFVEAFLTTIDCYVMGSRTYETLTGRELPRTRDTVEFYSGDLAQLVNGRLRPAFRTIWFVGGGMVAEVKAYKSGMVELRYEVRGHRGASRTATSNNSMQRTALRAAADADR